MTKSKNTKRALLASVLSMILCLAMLVGSTFAWFTDSVSSGKNKIVAGNLDIELEYATDFNEDGSVKTWTPVTADTKLFSELEADGETKNLWEPGHTEVVYLKISNVGNLALKYQFSVTGSNETVFTNPLGKTDCKLSDYLVFGKAESTNEIAKYASREAAWQDVGTVCGLREQDLAKSNDLLLPGAAEYVALVVYMPTTIGNEANYRGDVIPSIDLGVNLVATQTPHENDSFGDNYDSKQSMNADKLTAEGYSAVGSLENLEYNIDDPNASNPEAFITSSGKLFLNNDIDQTVTQWIFFSGESTTLDLNGHYQRETLFIDNGTNLTITDSLGGGSIKFVDVYDGTVTLENCDTKLHQGNGCIFAHEGGTMIINGGEHNPMLISAQNGGTIIINDGKFNSRAFGFQTFGSGTITVNGGTFIFDVANKEGIILGEGKQCVDNGDGTWSVVPIVDDENFDDPFAS